MVDTVPRTAIASVNLFLSSSIMQLVSVLTPPLGVWSSGADMLSRESVVGVWQGMLQSQGADAALVVVGAGQRAVSTFVKLTFGDEVVPHCETMTDTMSCNISPFPVEIEQLLFAD